MAIQRTFLDDLMNRSLYRRALINIPGGWNADVKVSEEQFEQTVAGPIDRIKYLASILRQPRFAQVLDKVRVDGNQLQVVTKAEPRQFIAMLQGLNLEPDRTAQVVAVIAVIAVFYLMLKA